MKKINLLHFGRMFTQFMDALHILPSYSYNSLLKKKLFYRLMVFDFRMFIPFVRCIILASEILSSLAFKVNWTSFPWILKKMIGNYLKWLKTLFYSIYRQRTTWKKNQLIEQIVDVRHSQQIPNVSFFIQPHAFSM